ncbi:OsmC family protein [Nocardia jiangxiensis]|uniref:OsmC family protein n=1 Tax=Nocardia jiangxiensis TaxID=282685 RepID=A0ABW6S4Y4_9NOCA|nr:OsmC family protein [Nocardia jiangxiensis]
MGEQSSTSTAAASSGAGGKTPTSLWVERTGTRRYTGRSSRGAEVLVGSDGVEGVFTPGELLKIALAACTGMSSDFPLSNRLGENYDVTIRVSGDADRESEVYPELNEIVELDLSELDEAGRERLLVTVQRAIDKVCTVGRTLKAGSQVNLSFQVDA